MINLKTSKKMPTINVKVDPITNIHVAEARASSTITGGSVEADGAVGVPVAEREVTVEAVDVDAMRRENSVLRLVIDILHSNPLIVNKYIIADDEILVEMIRLLCNAEDVQLDADDLGTGCITRKTYRKVNSIYVTSQGKTLNLKYDYPAVMKTLKDLHISVKYVF
jgi:hypothetical protein